MLREVIEDDRVGQMREEVRQRGALETGVDKFGRPQRKDA